MPRQVRGLDGRQGCLVSVDYDVLWEHTWGDMQEIGPVHRHVRKLIVDTVGPLGVTSVLDVGCGSGAILEALQRRLGLHDVAGVDISPRAIEVASRRVSGDLRVLDVMSDPLDRKFDLVLSSQVIEHIEDDITFLRRLRPLCRRYCFIGTMQGRMRASEASIGHFRNYSRAELEKKMTAAGFTTTCVIA